MNIEWSKEAEDSFNDIVDWYLTHMGWHSAEKFMNAIEERINLLYNNPYLGPKEESLADKQKPYRSLWDGKHCKIIYYLEETNNVIYIAYIWGCSQDPNKLQSKLR